MLLVGKFSIEDVRKEDVEKIEYFSMNGTITWKFYVIKEIINECEK